MPARFVVRSTPIEPSVDAPPPNTGPGVHAAFLRCIKAFEPTLAQALHDWPAPKPFALTTMVKEDGSWMFEVGVLRDSLIDTVRGALSGWSEFEVGHTAFKVASVEERAGASYLDLLAGSAPQSEWTLRIRSPLTFRAGAGGEHRDWPFPLPDLVFRDLARRWTTFAEVPLPEAVATVIDEHLAVSRLELKSRRHLIHTGGGWATGVVGVITYVAVRAEKCSAAGLAAVQALAQLADYSGVGDDTTRGMGWVVFDQTPATDAAARKRTARVRSS